MPAPTPEAAARGVERARATNRRKKERRLAAELTEREWTCIPPDYLPAQVAADPALSLAAKGVYLGHITGLTMVDVRDRDPRGRELLAAWAELVRAGYVDREERPA